MPEEEKEDRQDRIIEILEELLKWTKITSIPQVKKLLLDLLPSDEAKIAYHFSNGEHGSQEIAKSTSVSYVTVTKWWKVWTRAGIAQSIHVRGGERAKHLFSLEDFGIEVPEQDGVKKNVKTVNTPTSETKPEVEKVE